jgi:hypothetical protein
VPSGNVNEKRAALGRIVDRDAAMMRFDDGATDRETESDTGCRRFARPPRELVEDRLALRGWHAGPTINYFNDEFLSRHVGGDPYRCSGGRVFPAFSSKL